MRVALDGTPLLLPKTGVGRYTYELGHTLSRIYPDQQICYLYGIHWLYHLRRSLVRSTSKTSRQVRPLIPTVNSGPLWARFLPEDFKSSLKKVAARVEMGLRRPAIYHATNFVADRWNVPVVATVHDLSFIRYPETHPKERLDWIDKGLPRTLKEAHLIAVSHFTKQEMVELLQVPANRISVVYEGIDPRFQPVAPFLINRVLKEYGLESSRYILYLGTLEPRKNLVQLVKAYEQLPARLVRRYPLAIAGLSGWKEQPIYAAFKRLHAKGNLKLLGFVPDKDLPALYSGASLFVFPSLYEGFGFPPLEAMACGTATLVSNRASLPEVVGEGAALVDPEDADAMARRIEALLEDDKYRQLLATRGRHQARRFTWANCARDTWDVYQLVVGAN